MDEAKLLAINLSAFLPTWHCMLSAEVDGERDQQQEKRLCRRCHHEKKRTLFLLRQLEGHFLPYFIAWKKRRDRQLWHDVDHSSFSFLIQFIIAI